VVLARGDRNVRAEHVEKDSSKRVILDATAKVYHLLKAIDMSFNFYRFTNYALESWSLSSYSKEDTGRTYNDMRKQ
jgi:hypothetical protein